jgi:diguanylate cyclase (GGDEF)-like protein
MSSILIVEDNEMNRDMLSRRLTRRGFEVRLAEDGYQALTAARAQPPSIILLDLSLPGLSGWEVAERLKSDAATKSIPLIALTAHALAPDRDRALVAGCDDYDTKPVDLDRLLSKIERLLAVPVPASSARGTADRAAALGAREDKTDRGVVLLVDDTLENRDMLSRRLERRGFTVLAVTDGQAALDTLAEHPVDLVLLDVMMPGMNGLDVLQRIRESRSRADLPVVMVTARDQSQDVVDALALGANDYIAKPLDFEVALARIRTQLATRREDPLTGLPNRVLFNERIARLLVRHRERGSAFAIFFLDLDRFKYVNDSLGHAIGDQLLVAVARRLEHVLRSGDTVARLQPPSTIARLGGDEFAVALDRVQDARDAARIAERLALALADPFIIDGREILATASIGIVASHDRYESADAMLRDADAAMYAAKGEGRGQYRIFDETMRGELDNRLRLEADLARAIEREEFVLFYQPIVSLATGRVDGFEALVRWRHPELGLLAPARFIGVAEETGLVLPLGRWVLRNACRQLRSWDRLDAQDARLSMSVNLTAREFVDPFLVDDVAAVLDETGLDPSRLKLEILETALLESSQEILDTLRRLRALGVRLVLDDFGTGYSALSYLQDFPLHTLKVDRAFVQRIGSRQDSSELVRAIVAMAAAQDMDVTAEGIETAEQLARVSELHCLRGQGFYFSRPMVAADVEAWLSDLGSTPEEELRMANEE